MTSESASLYSDSIGKQTWELTMDEKTVAQLLKALSAAGLCVCYSHLIDNYSPELVDDDDYIIGKLEEAGLFGE